MRRQDTKGETVQQKEKAKKKAKKTAATDSNRYRFTLKVNLNSCNKP